MNVSEGMRPAHPAQNAFAESFQGRMRDECLNEHLFFSMNNARAVFAGWVEDFNTARPHSAIGYMTPAAYVVVGRGTEGLQRFKATERK